MNTTERTPLTELHPESQELALLRDIVEDGIDVHRRIDIVALPQEPKGIYGLLIDDDDGPRLQIMEARPSHRQERLISLSGIGPHLEHIKIRDPDCVPVVYFNDDFVMIIHDDSPESRRANTTQLLFERPEETRRLIRADGQSMTQKELVRFLRVTMDGCLLDDAQKLLDVARVISSHSSQTAHGSHTHGRESLGRDIESEVTSDVGEVPEIVKFQVRWSIDPDLPQTYQINAVVEIDPKTLSFTLSLVPSSLRMVEEPFLERLTTYLDGCCDVPVFYGLAGV